MLEEIFKRILYTFFSFLFCQFNRRHHCRRCGRVVCAACSTKRSQVRGVSARTCDECYEQTFGTRSVWKKRKGIRKRKRREKEERVDRWKKVRKKEEKKKRKEKVHVRIRDQEGTFVWLKCQRDSDLVNSHTHNIKIGKAHIQSQKIWLRWLLVCCRFSVKGFWTVWYLKQNKAANFARK